MRYNQIKGRSLTGYFKNNELYKMRYRRKWGIIFYVLDGEEITGSNRLNAANIEVFIEKGKISEIYQYQNPEGITDPPDSD